MLWEIYSNERFRKLLKKGESILSDDKYFELKYELKLMKYAFMIIVAVAGFLGYASFTDIKLDISNEIVDKTSSYYQQFDTLINLSLKEINNDFLEINNDFLDVYQLVDSVGNEAVKYYNQMFASIKRIGLRDSGR